MLCILWWNPLSRRPPRTAEQPWPRRMRIMERSIRHVNPEAIEVQGGDDRPISSLRRDLCCFVYMDSLLLFECFWRQSSLRTLLCSSSPPGWIGRKEIQLFDAPACKDLLSSRDTAFHADNFLFLSCKMEKYGQYRDKGYQLYVSLGPSGCSSYSGYLQERVRNVNPANHSILTDCDRSLAQGARNRLPAPGTIIASSYTSPLDVLYLAAIFDPIFTQSQHGSRQVRAISLESALASCFSVQNPLEMVGEQPKATDLMKLASQNRGRVIVVFPESTTSNGRGILKLSPSLLSAARETKIYPVSLRYTPADVVTPIPGWLEAARFIWRLNSRQTHCIRVRIGGPITLSNPGIASTESSPAPAKRAIPVKNGIESNFFDTLQASANQQPSDEDDEDDLSPTERQVLDAVADSLARLGRVKRVDLGVEQKSKFVHAWNKKGRGTYPVHFRNKIQGYHFAAGTQLLGQDYTIVMLHRPFAIVSFVSYPAESSGQRVFSMPFLAKVHHRVPTKDINSWIFDDLRYDEDDPIYISALDPSKSISARQAKKLIRQLAAGFRALGVQQGHCVLIHSFNDIYYPLAFLGIIAAGGTYAGTNPGYTKHELAHTIKTAKAKWVLTQPGLLGPIVEAMESTGASKDRIMVFNPNGEATKPGFKQWKDLLFHGEEDWVRFDDLETTKNSTAALLFSSGTTGLPKAAMLSHYNLIAQHTMVYEALPRPFRARRLMALPMFHAATAPGAFCTPLRAGEKAYILARFELEKWFWALEKYQITDLALVPPIAVMAINHPLNKKYSMQSVRVATCGAAPLDKRPQARMQELIGLDVPFTQVWGMSETSCIATRFPYPEKDITGSVGVPIPDLDTKLVDDDGKDISDFDVYVKLTNQCFQYFENPEANKRDFDSDGYFHTGDIGYVDGKTGFYYIVDRKKELIKVRAFQVAPPELEGVLLSHPDIIDAAVIGVTDPTQQGSELPRAYLVRGSRTENKPGEKDIHAYMRERLASYKMLAGGVVFVDEIPKNASGKILKRVLRDRAAKEMGPKL
nr:acyl-coa ligase azaf [Quercus suber]